MNKIPLVLIYTRLLIGFYIILGVIIKFDTPKNVTVLLILIALLTDVFDGIFARWLNISTEKLRRLDSNIDQIFYSCVGIATLISCPDFFLLHGLKLSVLVCLEGLTYLLCFLKFKKEIAFHSWGAKLWSIFIVLLLCQVTLTCNADSSLFDIFFYVGLFTRIEIIAIIFILKKWINDVPTFIHALQLRNGKEIKRNKLFNG